MGREPKVACIEINCFLKDAPKDGDLCKTCKPRWKYLAAIENGWCVPWDTTIYCGFPFDPHEWKALYLSKIESRRESE